jgi:hypothetical protein
VLACSNPRPEQASTDTTWYTDRSGVLPSGLG